MPVNHPDFRPEAFLIDLDGVLVYSHDAHVASYEEAFRGHGLTLEPRLVGLIRGGMARRDVLARSEAPRHLHEALSRAKDEAFGTAVRNGGVVAAEGAHAFLEALAALGCPAAVVTNSATAHAPLEALGLDSLVRAVVDVHAVARPKPDPEGFLRAARALGAPPERCVAVEDSPPGARAARAAGTFVVGVGEGLHPSEVDTLLEALPDIPLDLWLATEAVP